MRRLSMFNRASPLCPCGALLLVPLLAGGCSSLVAEGQSLGLPIQDWQNVRPVPQPSLGVQQLRHTVAFAPGAAALDFDQRAALLDFIAQLPASGSPAWPDQVFVVAGPAAPSLTERRIAAVGSVLRANGRAWQPGSLGGDGAAPPADDTLDVIAELTVVALPACPDWSQWPQDSFSNRPMSNFGCATAINLGLQLADPRDLSRGRTPGPSDGTVMSRSIERYRDGKTKDIIRDSASSEVFPSSGGGSEE